MTNDEHQDLLYRTTVDILHLCGDNNGPGSEAFGDVLDALAAFEQKILDDEDETTVTA